MAFKFKENWIHKLEEGGGQRYLFILLGCLGLVLLVFGTTGADTGT